MNSVSTHLTKWGWGAIIWGLPWSHGVMSAGTAMVLMAAVMRGWRRDDIRAEASERIRRHPWIVALILWWIWTGCSLFWSEDMAKGMDMLPVLSTLPLLALAWLFQDDPPTATWLNWTGWSATTAFAVCLVNGAYQGLEGAAEIDWAPWTSHIRLSFLAALGLGWALVRGQWFLASALSASWLAFGLFSGSLTAVAMLPLGLVFGTWSLLPSNRRLAFVGSLVLLTAALVAGAIIGLKPVPLDADNLPRLTPWGNPYNHQPERSLSVNGHRLHAFSCPAEWDSAWAMVSEISLSQPNPRGHALRNNMQRYLTSLGLPKDGATIASLSPWHVQAIERGDNHHVPASGLVKRWRDIRFGFETWKDTGNPTGSSIWQRWEHGKAALVAWRLAPWMGHGLGGQKQAMLQAYDAMESKLSENHRHGAHNQHFTLAIQSGVMGLILWILTWGSFARTIRQTTNWQLVAWGLTVFLICTTFEDALESQAGMLVSAMAVLLSHQVKDSRASRTA